MKAAILSPANLLQRYSVQSDYHLCLAHLVMRNQMYRDFYKTMAENGDYVILDNSVIELGRPVGFSELQAAVDAIHPSELVLADYPRDPIQTYIWATNYGERFKARYPRMKLMAVPQWYEDRQVIHWLENYDHLAKHEFIDTIGIPKFLGQHRYTICRELDLNRRDKEYHLLGTWGNPIETLDLATEYPWIRGVDTKAPVRFGINGIVLHPKQGLLAEEIRHHLSDMSLEYAEDSLPIITHHNVKTFQDWARGKQPASVLQFRR